MAMKSRSTLVLIMSALCPALAWGVDPQSVDIQGFDFTPTLELSESYDDNFRELEHDVQSSMLTKVAPSFELKAEDRNSATRLLWQPTRYIYHEQPDASNTAQRVRLDSIMEFTDRHRLKLGAEARRYEGTASTAVDGINDRIRTQRLNALYTYGARTASNQIDLGASHARLRYANADGINDDKERDSTTLTTTWYHRVGSNTRSLLEYSHSRFDYLQSDSLRSSRSHALLTGAEWDFTARTSGKVRVGYERKDFDSDQAKDLDNPTWQVDLKWKPRTYSTFTFVARQALAEGDDGSDAIKATSALLGWRHGWTERITTVAEVGVARNIYEGQDRTDDIRSYNLGVVYAMRRWLDIELGYRYRSDDSDAENESYNRNVFTLSITTSL